MDKRNRVLLIGVDTTKLAGTGVTEFDSATIRKEAEEALQALITEGYAARWHFMDLTNNPLQRLTDDLKENAYDCILVGAGIRRRPETLGLFERVVNIIHQNAPQSTICFNADVYDTVAAVKRTLKMD
jgi:hypothetical protein